MKNRLVALVLVLLAAPILGGDPNVCDEPGEAPDVIVGDLPGITSYGSRGEWYAYSVGTTSCNIGSCWLNWVSNTPEHTVIAQNLFRVKDGRIEQIGQGWLKHGFFALSQELCDTGCIGTNGTHLGVNCSDPYTSGLNGFQSNLGPRSEVNPSTGEFPYPFTTIGRTGNRLYKRIQVHQDDLNPELNDGALYFAEGQYVTKDDAAAGNGTNNNSYRPVVVDPFSWSMYVSDETRREKAAIQAWREVYPNVREGAIDIENDGRFIVAGRTTANPDGSRHYEYAVQNITSDRGARSFSVPVPIGATVSNIGFHDVDAHSGEPFDPTDWVGRHDAANGRVIWETATYEENVNANALRWGTLYNFYFDVDTTAVVFGDVSMNLFKPQVDLCDPRAVSTQLLVPNPCNGDGVCDPSETMLNCPADCPPVVDETPMCGDLPCAELERLADPCKARRAMRPPRGDKRRIDPARPSRSLD